MKHNIYYGTINIRISFIGCDARPVRKNDNMEFLTSCSFLTGLVSFVVIRLRFNDALRSAPFALLIK